MSPVTSSGNHSPIKSASSVDINLGNDESDSKIDDVGGNKSDDLTVFQYIHKEVGFDMSCNTDFMELMEHMSTISKFY